MSIFVTIAARRVVAALANRVRGDVIVDSKQIILHYAGVSVCVVAAIAILVATYLVASWAGVAAAIIAGVVITVMGMPLPGRSRHTRQFISD